MANHSARPRRSLCWGVALGAVAVALVGCDANPQPRESAFPPAESRSVSASPSPTPTVSDSVITYTRGSAQMYVPESKPPHDDRDTAGSGCTPGMGDSLPDGEWRGIVVAGDSDTIDFDLVCSWVFTSQHYQDGIVDADSHDGPAIYVTQNDNPMTRTLTLAHDITVWPAAPGSEPIALDDFHVQRLQDGWDEVWVLINDGEVTEMVEVHFP